VTEPELRGRLAYVTRELTDFRRRCREGGYAWPVGLEAALAVASGASGRQGAPNLASMVDGSEDHCMTYAAVAERLAVSERTVDRLVASGALPTVDVGGSARVRAADLAAYVAGLPMRGAA